MAKRELWQIGWLAPILDLVGSFPVDPGAPDRAALRKSAGILARGEALVIFPEGRIAPDGKLAALLPGVLQLALKSGVSIVPVGLAGARSSRALRTSWCRAQRLGKVSCTLWRANFAGRLAGFAQTRGARNRDAAVGTRYAARRLKWQNGSD